MSTYSIGINVHKSTAQIAVKNKAGEYVDQRRVPNEELEDALVEVRGMVGVRLAAWRLQLGQLASLPVSLRELLDAPPADSELLRDDLGVDVLVNNALTDPVGIGLLELHFTQSITGEIMPTKSLADTTDTGPREAGDVRAHYSPRPLHSC